MDDAHEEAAALLVRAGLDRPTARAFVALATGGEATTPELERRSGLRQSESSLATMRLRTRGWIAVRADKKPGRGRPTNVYTLRVPVKDALVALAHGSPDPGALLRVRELLAREDGPEPI